MKYIMVEVELDSGTFKYVPFIFPTFMVHKDADKWLVHWLRREHDMVGKTVSAGFISVDTGQTYGESESLKLKSHPDDGRLIAAYTYAHGLSDTKRE